VEKSHAVMTTFGKCALSRCLSNNSLNFQRISNSLLPIAKGYKIRSEAVARGCGDIYKGENLFETFKELQV
jgi:hypothetical protein